MSMTPFPKLGVAMGGSPLASVVGHTKLLSVGILNGTITGKLLRCNSVASYGSTVIPYPARITNVFIGRQAMPRRGEKRFLLITVPQPSGTDPMPQIRTLLVSGS